MIFCAKWLLKERISKMSLIRTQVITQQATIDNHARRPAATSPQVAPVKTSLSTLVTSPAARDKVSEYAGGSLITNTTAETTPLSAGDVSAATVPHRGHGEIVYSRERESATNSQHCSRTSEASCCNACYLEWRSHEHQLVSAQETEIQASIQNGIYDC